MHRHKWKHEPPAGWNPEAWRSEEWTERRRFFVRRFAFGFLLLAAFLGVVLGGLVYLVLALAERMAVGSGEVAVILCAVTPLLFLAVTVASAVVFRRLGSPLADLMAAADAVAAGDLSARVPERGRGEMARLAGRFNRMTAELERAAQSRRNLTADVAHELRTPLHILQGNLEGVLDGVYEPTPDHIRLMLDETHRLTRLVEELQTLSLAEAGQLPLHARPVAVADLLGDAAARFAAAATEAGVTLRVRAVDGAPVVMVDPDRLHQALSNLVANALRHTPAGGQVTLSAAAVPGGVELAVADSGAGIDPADLPYVFDRFWRGDRARRRDGGVGLGLPIARRLVEAHGGMIEVESEVGVGTTFTIRLPESKSGLSPLLPL